MPVSPRLRPLLTVGSLLALAAGCSDPSDQPVDDARGADCDACLPAEDGGVPPFDATVDAPIDSPIDALIPDDCDADGPIHPGADEVLDGVDNDCDGLVDEITVCTAGSTYGTIGAGIAAAPDGGSIFVCGGTYNERLNLTARVLRIVAADGPTATVIDGGGQGSVVTVTGSSEVAVIGFTIRNGAAAEGAGVLCRDSKLLVANSIITGNTASQLGGGLSAWMCSLDLSGSLVTDNDAGDTGGGVLLSASMGAVRNNQFLRNEAEYGAGVAVLEGTILLADNSISNNIAGVRGGGLYHASDAMVAGNTFANNQAGWTGGGVHVVTHHATFSDNIISGNTSPNDGGGIYFHQSSGTFRANHVHHNHSGDDGGGVRVFESAMTLEANLIEQNSAGDCGGGVRISHVPSLFVDNVIRANHAQGTGGGIDMDNDASTVIGGEIADNVAGGSGGGIFHWLGPWNGAVLSYVRITNNRAWRGGGIFLDDNFKPVTMRGLIVTGNHASRGGGLMVRGTDYTITNSVFAGNDANRGGGIYAGVNSANSSWTHPCPPCPPTEPVGRIAFSVFHDNEADEGAGLWTDTARVTVTSSIFADNDGPAVTVAEATSSPGVLTPLAWIYNDTMPASFVGMRDPTGSNGNISVAPGFMGPAEGDFRLHANSSCIDAGDPAVRDGDGTRADMGFHGGPQ